jgi:hypothetical protein
MKSTGSKAAGWAKGFGVMTALFGGIECVVEKYRAKHDVCTLSTAYILLVLVDNIFLFE